MMKSKKMMYEKMGKGKSMTGVKCDEEKAYTEIKKAMMSKKKKYM